MKNNNNIIIKKLTIFLFLLHIQARGGPKELLEFTKDLIAYESCLPKVASDLVGCTLVDFVLFHEEEKYEPILSKEDVEKTKSLLDVLMILELQKFKSIDLACNAFQEQWQHIMEGKIDYYNNLIPLISFARILMKYEGDLHSEALEMYNNCTQGMGVRTEWDSVRAYIAENTNKAKQFGFGSDGLMGNGSERSTRLIPGSLDSYEGCGAKLRPQSPKSPQRTASPADSSRTDDSNSPSSSRSIRSSVRDLSYSSKVTGTGSIGQAPHQALLESGRFEPNISGELHKALQEARSIQECLIRIGYRIPGTNSAQSSLATAAGMSGVVPNSLKLGSLEDLKKSKEIVLEHYNRLNKAHIGIGAIDLIYLLNEYGRKKFYLETPSQELTEEINTINTEFNRILILSEGIPDTDYPAHRNHVTADLQKQTSAESSDSVEQLGNEENMLELDLITNFQQNFNKLYELMNSFEKAKISSKEIHLLMKTLMDYSQEKFFRLKKNVETENKINRQYWEILVKKQRIEETRKLKEELNSILINLSQLGIYHNTLMSGNFENSIWNSDQITKCKKDIEYGTTLLEKYIEIMGM